MGKNYILEWVSGIEAFLKTVEALVSRRRTACHAGQQSRYLAAS